MRLYDAMEHGTGHKDSYSHRGAVLDACLVGENVSYSGGLDMDVLRYFICCCSLHDFAVTIGYRV